MEKNYVIKSVIAKCDMAGKVCGYSVNYHHKNYPDSVQSQFYSVDDMKTLFSVNNEAQAQSLVGVSCYVERKLIINK